MFTSWFQRVSGGKGNGHQEQDTPTHLIDLRHVVKTYANGAGSFTALRSIDLQVSAGEFIAVVGKSGSGKSTLLNMITGIDRPTSGEVWVNGTPLHRQSEDRMATWRGHSLGIVFQFFQLLPTLTVAENIMLPMDFAGRGTMHQRRERALYLLGQVDLADQADKLPSALSGGQQQRAAIARALANDPPVLVADEPTGNLDSRTAGAIFRLFEDLVGQGKTILMVTHDQDLTQRVPHSLTLADGAIVDQVRQSPMNVTEIGPDIGAEMLSPATLQPEVHYA
jgi:putative ABC transport system ATP-binding protein